MDKAFILVAKGAFLFLSTSATAATIPTCPVTPLGDDEVSAESIQAQLQDKVPDVATLLSCLPDSYKKNMALMRKSRSVQATGDPQRPRVILYGKTGKLMLAFTDATPGSIEMIQQNAKTGKFEPKSIDFSKPAGSRQTDTSACKNCHGDPTKAGGFKPVWDSYDVWPGAYGSLSAQGTDMMPPGECADYKKFYKSNSAGGGASASSPYRQLRLAEPSEHRKGGKLEFCGFKDDKDGSRRSPTGHLNHLLNRLTMDSAKLVFESSPGFKKFRFGLLAAAIGCGKMEFGPPVDGNMLSTMMPSSGNSYPSVAATMETASQNDTRRRMKEVFASGDFAAICQRPHSIFPNYIYQGDAYIALPLSNCSTCGSCFKSCKAKPADPTSSCPETCFESCQSGCKSECETLAKAEGSSVPSLLFKTPDSTESRDGRIITDYRFVGEKMGVNLGEFGYSSNLSSKRDNEYTFADGLAGIRALKSLMLLDPKFTQGVPFLQGSPPPVVRGCYPNVPEYLAATGRAYAAADKAKNYGQDGSMASLATADCPEGNIRNFFSEKKFGASGVADFPGTFSSKEDCEDDIASRMKNCKLLAAMSDSAMINPDNPKCSEQAAEQFSKDWTTTAKSTLYAPFLMSNQKKYCDGLKSKAPSQAAP